MKLDVKEINIQLEALSGWTYENNSIMKTFEFKNFLGSVDFVNKITPLAENLQHHPDININYDKVAITLSTHDEGGVTEKDFNMAHKIDSLV